MCVKIAYRMTRKCPWIFDEAESEAYLALGEALKYWCDSGEPYPFDSDCEERFYYLAAMVIRRKIYKLVYEFPLGYRTRESRKRGASREGIPISSEFTDPEATHKIPDDSEEVGWELEYEDTVKGIALGMPPLSKKVFLMRMLHAESASMDDAASILGTPKKTVKDRYWNALSFL